MFGGRGFLLKNFNNPILNSFKAIDKISEITMSTINAIEEKAFSKENNHSDATIHYSSFKFPLNNSDYLAASPNYHDDTNLNLIFLEFELDQTKNAKDKVKYLTEVNNDFVEMDFHFVLNVIFLLT